MHHRRSGFGLAQSHRVRLPQQRKRSLHALQYGHGIGLAIWEKPVISRLVSLEHSYEIKPGMVFALETFWPSTDGWSAARIEEEIVVTETGHEVITCFPAEELLVAGAHYVGVNGPLATDRESEAPPSRRAWWRWWKRRQKGTRRSNRLKAFFTRFWEPGRHSG